MQLTGPETDLLMKLMSASTLRAKVIANNISNQNTPGYRRKVVEFEDVLLQRINTGKSVRTVNPEVRTDVLTPTGPDGNNVNLELEMNSMRENRLLFETYASILGHQMEVLRASIQEGR